MVDAATALFLAMSATLLASTALLLYPAYAYSQNVMYSRGVKVLATSLLLLTIGWMLGVVQAYGYVSLNRASLVSQTLYTASSGLFLWAAWEFARDVVTLEESGEELESPEPTASGFEAATAGADERHAGGFDDAGQ